VTQNLDRSFSFFFLGLLIVALLWEKLSPFSFVWKPFA